MRFDQSSGRTSRVRGVAAAVLATIGVAAAIAACADRPAVSPEAGSARATALCERTVVLVAIDGVRWQEVFKGVDQGLAAEKGLSPAERIGADVLVPNIHQLLAAEGAAVGAPSSGAEMTASGPNFVSLPGYMEMLTGRRDTGCMGNDCGDVPFPTVADEVADRGGLAAVIASWQGILHAASASPGRVVMSIGRHGVENRSSFTDDPNLGSLLREGETSGPGPGEGDFRRDESTGKLACAYLETRRPAFLFVGLGETDEFAHQGNYRAYLNALHAADAVIGRLAAEVDELTESGHPSTLIVTTDHGRAGGFSSHGGDHPESARVFLVAAGSGVRARGAVPSASPRHLADVAQTVRRMLRLPRVEGAPAGKVLSELFAAPDTALATR